MITVRSYQGFGYGCKEQPFDRIEDAIKAFNSMDPCHEMPRLCRDGKTVAEHDVESGMAVMFWADDVRLVYNSVTFDALLDESISLDSRQAIWQPGEAPCMTVDKM
ncbi:MAG: hypothetical protein PHD37_06430 [Gallionellaceae bacterium]|nr:hypothetical protein [Gallionellaceae bacterium]